ncbi:MAG: aminotransferase class IV [Candidatus Nanopelagicales bacterium]
MKFWLGGLVPAEEAVVSVLDHGFTVGDGVFETLRTAVDPRGQVRPFAPTRHLRRLARSAAGLGLPAPDLDLVAEAIEAVCQANPELVGGGRLRITYTSGVGPPGSARLAGTSTLVVTAAASARWPATTTVALSPWPRNELGALAGLKTTSYAENAVMLAHANSMGASEALLVNIAGNVCEGTGSNVFLVFAGEALTPPLSSGCLPGITRDLLLQWCADAGIGATEADIAVDDVVGAEEIFLTSSTRDVNPVATVLDSSGAPIWSGSGAGTVTARIAAVFSDRAARDLDP